jgi:hypothetical protein
MPILIIAISVLAYSTVSHAQDRISFFHLVKKYGLPIFDVDREGRTFCLFCVDTRAISYAIEEGNLSSLKRMDYATTIAISCDCPDERKIEGEISEFMKKIHSSNKLDGRIYTTLERIIKDYGPPKYIINQCLCMLEDVKAKKGQSFGEMELKHPKAPRCVAHNQYWEFELKDRSGMFTAWVDNSLMIKKIIKHGYPIE